MNSKSFRHTSSEGRGSSHYLILIIQFIVLIIAVGIFIGVLGPGTTIRCERTVENNVDCVVTKTLFGTIVLKEYSVPGVLAAALDENCNGSDCAYAMMLYGTSGKILVDDNYVRDMTLRQKIADTINKFLQNPDTRFVELKDQYPVGIYIAGGVVLLVLAGLLGYSIWQGRQVTHGD